MKKLLPIVILALTACSSIPPEQINGRISAWQAATIDEVIQYWGVPAKKQEISGKFYAEWINREKKQGNSSISVGSGTRTGGGAIGIGLSLFDVGSSDESCSRMVTYTQDGQITDISWKGDQEYCYKLTPDRQEMIKNKAIMDAN